MAFAACMQTTRRHLVKAGLVTGAVAALSAPRARHARHGRRRPAPHEPVQARRRQRRPAPGRGGALDPVGRLPARRRRQGRDVDEHATPCSGRWPRDVRFRTVVRTGHGERASANAHSVHVEVAGLLAGARVLLPVPARAPTSRGSAAPARLPQPTRPSASLAMSFVSCAMFEHGWFTAYRRLAEDQPDLVAAPRRLPVRVQAGRLRGPERQVRDLRGPETVTLANYRQRHAQYKTDPDLQAAHAVAPWLVVFDDHEVDNNWADETPANAASAPGFMNRRAAAFKAYYENMPLRGPRSRRAGHADLPPAPVGPAGEPAHARHPPVPQRPGLRRRLKDCAGRRRPDPVAAGDAQEQWLADGFASSRATWDVIGQQVFFGRRDTHRDAGQHRLDGRLGRLPASRPRHRLVGATRRSATRSCSPATCTRTGPRTCSRTSRRPTHPWSARSSSARRSPPAATGTTSRPASTRGRRTTPT